MFDDIPNLVNNMKKSVEDLKDVLLTAEVNQDYSQAKSITKDLFRCYTVIEELLRRRDMCYDCMRDNCITVDLSEQDYFDSSYDDIEAELMQEYNRRQFNS